ncbi:MAG TPA: Yip1 family protein [Thermoanaerobaculia bacterium]|nr:Yip1 family protein [Thermoanaerobaculia bacterium]
MERLKDLVTILYRPRETMRRILDQPDRWAPGIVFLAAVCASANQLDARNLADAVPNIKVLPTIAIIALIIVLTAATWVIALYILSWIATPIGRMMGGTGTVGDVRAGLAWAMVPVIWSPIYRVPLVILATRSPIVPEINVRKVVIDFLSHGGCSIIILFLGFQLLFELWCVVLGSFTVAEAQRFSTQKGFVNVVITIALPLMVMFAAIFTLRKVG